MTLLPCPCCGLITALAVAVLAKIALLLATLIVPVLPVIVAVANV